MIIAFMTRNLSRFGGLEAMCRILDFSRIMAKPGLLMPILLYTLTERRGNHVKLVLGVHLVDTPWLLDQIQKARVFGVITIIGISLEVFARNVAAH